jgi:hypothetical protein
VLLGTSCGHRPVLTTLNVEHRRYTPTGWPSKGDSRPPLVSPARSAPEEVPSAKVCAGNTAQLSRVASGCAGATEADWTFATVRNPMVATNLLTSVSSGMYP